MPSIFEPSVASSILQRIESVTIHNQQQWGKMNAAQMLQHCKLATDVAFDKQDLKINFLMKLLGRMLKKKVFYGGELKKNSPTAKEFIIASEIDFEKAKSELISNFSRFGVPRLPYCSSTNVSRDFSWSSTTTMETSVSTHQKIFS